MWKKERIWRIWCGSTHFWQLHDTIPGGNPDSIPFYLCDPRLTILFVLSLSFLTCEVDVIKTAKQCLARGDPSVAATVIINIVSLRGYLVAVPSE